MRLNSVFSSTTMASITPLIFGLITVIPHISAFRLQHPVAPPGSISPILSQNNLSINNVNGSSSPNSDLSKVLRKRSLSHENKILNAAWPASAMWAFLPKHKKPQEEESAQFKGPLDPVLDEKFSENSRHIFQKSTAGSSPGGSPPTPSPKSTKNNFPNFLESPIGSEEDEDLVADKVYARDNSGGHSTFLKRSGVVSGENRKRTLKYDIPQIECPPADDGMERFACPSADRLGRYRCVDDHVLCDGFIDCPGKEDEDLQACMFYKTTKAHLDVLADALLRWARGKR